MASRPSKSVCGQQPHVGSNPTRSAKERVRLLPGYFFGDLKGFEPRAVLENAPGARFPREAACAAAQVESHPLRQIKVVTQRVAAFIWSVRSVGFEPRAVLENAPGARFLREAACAAAQVESHPLRQNRNAILTR